MSHSDDVADEEDAEADQQHQRGGAQPQPQQRLRLFREVRPAAGDDLPLGTADLRPLAGPPPRAAGSSRRQGSAGGACLSRSYMGQPLPGTIVSANHTRFAKHACSRVASSVSQRSPHSVSSNQRPQNRHPGQDKTAILYTKSVICQCPISTLTAEHVRSAFHLAFADWDGLIHANLVLQR